MSLEESINLLVNEIKQLRYLMQNNNALLLKQTEEPPLKRKQTLTEADAAKYIGMSRSFLAQHRMNGDRKGRLSGPKPTRLGRRVFYDLEELNSWLARNQVG